MFIYIHDGPMTIMKRTGGAVFCDTTGGYKEMRHHVLTLAHRSQLLKKTI